MAKQPVPYTEHNAAVMRAMASRGLLLGAYDASGRPNAMTIGWGAIGHMWGIPVWIVLVRPSRYTYSCIEHTQSFTVNVPTETMRDACAVCGSRSGRSGDKLSAAKLTAQRASTVLAPVLVQCPMVYECHVVHSTDILPSRLTDEIRGAYMDHDYHRIYYAKILAVAAEPDAAQLLKD